MYTQWEKTKKIKRVFKQAGISGRFAKDMANVEIYVSWKISANFNKTDWESDEAELLLTVVTLSVGSVKDINYFVS